MRSQTISLKLQRIAEQAKSRPDMVFTTLVHHIDVDFLREAYYLTRKSGSPGLDGVTGLDYGENLDENLIRLHGRMKGGKYKAPLLNRIWIVEDGGKRRPIDITEFEDKVVQRAFSMLLSAVYEQDFLDFSYGFRPGRSAHQALALLRDQCMNRLSWVVDADVSGFFNSINHRLLMQFLKKRINDGVLLRFIGKWLNAGIMDGFNLSYPEKGTPQGGVISPLLANIFLHYILDEWFTRELQPTLKGRSSILRFADDFVVCCECESDSYRVMSELVRRFSEFELRIHPEKTKLVRFVRPPKSSCRDDKNGTFDFLGFTHYWGKSVSGYWVVKRKTRRKKLNGSMKAMWKWCKKNRHMWFSDQHEKICQKLRGHYQYFGVRCNYVSMAKYFSFTVRAWRYWLSRRSQKSAISWDKFNKLIEMNVLPKPRIIHSI